MTPIPNPCGCRACHVCAIHLAACGVILPPPPVPPPPADQPAAVSSKRPAASPSLFPEVSE